MALHLQRNVKGFSETVLVRSNFIVTRDVCILGHQMTECGWIGGELKGTAIKFVNKDRFISRLATPEMHLDSEEFQVCNLTILTSSDLKCFQSVFAFSNQSASFF